MTNEKLSTKRLLAALEQFDVLKQRYPVDLWLLRKTVDDEKERKNPVAALQKFITQTAGPDAGPGKEYGDLEYVLRVDVNNWRPEDQMKHHLVPEISGVAWCKLLREETVKPSDEAFCDWLDDQRLHGSFGLPENYIRWDAEDDEFWGDPDCVIPLYAAQELRVRFTKQTDPEE